MPEPVDSVTHPFLWNLNLQNGKRMFSKEETFLGEALLYNSIFQGLQTLALMQALSLWNGILSDSLQTAYLMMIVFILWAFLSKNYISYKPRIGLKFQIFYEVSAILAVKFLHLSFWLNRPTTYLVFEMISLPFSMILISLWEKQIPSFIDIVVSLCLIVNCTFRVLSGQSNSVGILVAFLHSFFTSLQQLAIHWTRKELKNEGNLKCQAMVSLSLQMNSLPFQSLCLLAGSLITSSLLSPTSNGFSNSPTIKFLFPRREHLKLKLDGIADFYLSKVGKEILWFSQLELGMFFCVFLLTGILVFSFTVWLRNGGRLSLVFNFKGITVWYNERSLRRFRSVQCCSDALFTLWTTMIVSRLMFLGILVSMGVFQVFESFGQKTFDMGSLVSAIGAYSGALAYGFAFLGRNTECYELSEGNELEVEE